MMTTPIYCQYTVETLLDDLRQIFFKRLQPKLYQEKFEILKLILQCQQRILIIDSLIKNSSMK